VAEYTERRVAAEDQLKRVDIRSPSAGYVHQLAVHTVGGVISPAEPAMLIVPVNESLKLTAKVMPQDIDQLSIGQHANVRVHASNQRTTPELSGTVTRISATCPRGEQSGISYYTISVALPADEIAKLGRREAAGRHAGRGLRADPRPHPAAVLHQAAPGPVRPRLPRVVTPLLVPLRIPRREAAGTGGPACVRGAPREGPAGSPPGHAAPAGPGGDPAGRQETFTGPSGFSPRPTKVAMSPDPDDCALFLDFDGTSWTSPSGPDRGRGRARPRRGARVLARSLGGALAIVSGRSIAFLDRHLGEGAFDAAGLHGLERRLGGAYQGCRPEDHPALRAGVADLQGLFADDPRIIIEDKGCSVAVHWRLAPERLSDARGAAGALAERLGDAYRIQYGKAVAEILPASAGKGRVIASFLEDAPYRSRHPVFVGDDLTDEHGFEAVNAHGGVSVRIGPGDTVASLRLPSPADLRRVLRGWAAGGPNPFVPAGPA
jgi:trehalose 6-phosphate phosphatase